MFVPGNSLFLRSFGTPPLTCGYALDDDGSIAGSFGFGFAPATAPAYQEITYTLTGAATGNAAITTPASPFTAPANFTSTSGKFGVGFYVTQTVTASDDSIWFELNEWVPPFSPGNGWWIRVRGDTGVVELRSGSILGAKTQDYSLVGIDATTATFGIYSDKDTGKSYYVVNGVVYEASAPRTVDNFFLATVVDDGASAPVGQTVTFGILPDAADLTLMGFPSGTLDLCGNPITYIPISCAMPFSVPDAGITMSNGYQTGALTTASGTNSYATYLPYTTNFWDTTYTIDIATGSHVFEWSPDLFPHPAGGFTYWQQVANFTDTAGNVIGYVTLEALSVNYNIQLYITNGPSSSSYTIGPSLPSRIGVAFDSSGPTLRVYVDGTQRLTGTYLTADSPAVINMNFETVSVAGGDIGQSLKFTYVSNAADMTGTNYPSGSVDKCGNVI